MGLAAGTRLGTYEIVRQIGAGGMGEVYRARDTSLGRDVALKILPELFTSDTDRVARLKREAQVLASLNHPNIAQIYGLESNALVMELVDGEELSAIIARGPIPLAEALPIASQIADALEAAHDRGIVHRDLKPANIKVRGDGTVKVLDFGLAKAIDPVESSPSALINSPTMSVRATAMGMILGTAAYMSPEQAAGKPVDKRTDLWAFGVVLLEMLTGRQTFEGETVSHVLASVLKDTPDLSALPVDTPAPIRTLLRRCLEKDRKKRLDSAAAARLEIEEAISGDAARDIKATPVKRSRSRVPGATVLPWVLAAAGMIAVWIAMRAAPAPAAPVTRSVIDLPQGLAIRSRQRAVALSPDGSRLAVVLTDAKNRSRLFVRSLDQLELRPLAGTDEASDPFWSPDGRSLGFFTSRELKRVDLPDGPVRTIASIEQGRGGSWGSGDRAVFSALAPGSKSILTLYEVSMAGGGPGSAIAEIQPTERSQARLPTILPDGAGTLFLGVGPRDPQVLHLLDSSRRVRTIANINSEAHYVPPGWLAYVRDHLLMVQPFDLRTQTLSGTAQVVAQGVAFDSARATAQVTFSSAPPTTLVYERDAGVPISQLTWIGANGAAQGTIGDPAQFSGEVAISPDGGRALVAIQSEPQSGAQLWIVDLASGVRSPLTAAATATSDAVWSADGKRVAYRASGTQFVVRDVNAPESSAIVQQTGNNAWVPGSWTPDGLGIVSALYQSPRGFDIGVVAADGKSAPRLLIDSPAQEYMPKLSPDGRWLAFISNESGQDEVYVTPYPGLGTKWPLTTTGADAFEWTGSDTVMYRGAGDHGISAVVFRPAAGRIDVTKRSPMLEGRGATSNALPAYAVPVGRFLDSVVLPGQRMDRPLVLVTNWQSEIRR
jgi:Tol biopolymer transport system component/predicted Ser/Thr protein kinase